MSSSSAVPTPNPSSAAWANYIDTQNITLIGPDGTPTSLTLEDIAQQTYFILNLVASFAFAVGVAGILMIVLLVQLDVKKARRPIFILNFASLVFLCLRAIDALASWCSQWLYGVAEYQWGTVAQYSHEGILVSNTFSTICELIIFALVMASLILQVRVVFAAEPKTRLIVTVILTLLALLVWSTLLAYESGLLQILYGTPAGIFNSFTLLYHIFDRSFIGFIGICSLLFLYKLLVTIKRRKGMGFKSFGPLHVLAIMFGQCLVVPLVLLIIQEVYSDGRFTFTEITLTLIVASLPVSSIWASHVAEGVSRQNVTTTSSSVTTSSGLSNRLRNYKNFFRDNKKPDSESTCFSDLEKSSNLTDLEAGKRNNSLDVSQLSPTIDET